MNIVVAGGLCVGSDAISSAILSQAEILRELPGVESVTIVTHHFDRRTTVDVVEVADAWSFTKLDVVDRADLVIFHWGIRYPMFDALTVVAATTRTVVHFHNVTPPALVADEERPNLERSIEQIQLLHLVDCEIWTESGFNSSTLASWGVDPDRVTFMPFPIEAPGLLRASPTGDRVELLTVGRITAAKGVDVLLDAMEMVFERMDRPPSLTIAGNAALSDRAFIDEITTRAAAPPFAGSVHLITGLDDDELWSLFASADIVVSPSLHEGLCVPVIEAYSTGCRVIGTDAGNLAYVVLAPDPIVPAGDPAALADAIVALVGEVADGDTVRPTGADALVDAFTTASTKRRLRDAVERSGAERRAYARTSWIESGMSRRTSLDA